MSLLALDLGGTKLAVAILDEDGAILFHKKMALQKRKGKDVSEMIVQAFRHASIASRLAGNEIKSVGICVPGIYHSKTGNVWAPNIAGWDDFPLLATLKKVAGKIPVNIDSDRACSILAEQWKGNARKCRDAIFLAVGTGIGAGILIDGRVLRGTHDIAGAIGWMALNPPFKEKYIQCGCFEHYCSGEGIAKQAQHFLKEKKNYNGELKNKSLAEITCEMVFQAYENKDDIAKQVINNCIQFWGMATANLVSLFNPEKIIFGGGVFGPAVSLIPAIKEEATKWAQPISIQQVSFESSGLGTEAGVIGAGFLALQNLQCQN